MTERSMISTGIASAVSGGRPHVSTAVMIVAEVTGMWLQQPSDDVPDVVTERYECPECGSVIGPLQNLGVALATLTVVCCGVTVEVVPSTQSDGSDDPS